MIVHDEVPCSVLFKKKNKPKNIALGVTSNLLMVYELYIDLHTQDTDLSEVLQWTENMKYKTR